MGHSPVLSTEKPNAPPQLAGRRKRRTTVPEDRMLMTLRTHSPRLPGSGWSGSPARLITKDTHE